MRGVAVDCSVSVSEPGSIKRTEYFSDGLAEEIINALTRIANLRVTARTSAFAFRGSQADVRKIGEALNVASVLEGSVRKSGTAFASARSAAHRRCGWQQPLVRTPATVR